MMTDSWQIINPSNTDGNLVVDFTISGIVYQQILFPYWSGTDVNGNPISGGIRTDTTDNATTDLNAYLLNYAAGIAAANAAPTGPLAGLSGTVS
jgi:hypothetical protein